MMYVRSRRAGQISGRIQHFVGNEAVLSSGPSQLVWTVSIGGYSVDATVMPFWENGSASGRSDVGNFMVHLHDLDEGYVPFRSPYRPGQELVPFYLEANSDLSPYGALDMILKVNPSTEGFRIRYRGADLDVKVRTPRAAELAALMPEKLPPDTSKMLLCPMPGLVVSIAVEEGDEVQDGQALATVEAMKMENVLRAERKSVVKKINAAAGASLAVDDVIMEFE
jgi:propionyl-CoA carboxylase alpha chain